MPGPNFPRTVYQHLSSIFPNSTTFPIYDEVHKGRRSRRQIIPWLATNWCRYIFKAFRESAKLCNIWEYQLWQQNISFVKLSQETQLLLCWIGQNTHFSLKLGYYFPSKICCKFVKIEVNTHMKCFLVHNLQGRKINIFNKLASLGATLVRNYDPLTHSLTGVKCRATSVAKK